MPNGNYVGSAGPQTARIWMSEACIVAGGFHRIFL